MESTSVHSRRTVRVGGPLVLLVTLLLGSGLATATSAGTPKSHVGPEGVLIYNVPDLASSSTTRTGTSVDGITCRTQAKETVKYHIHAHVAIYVHGQLRRLPAGVGITKPQIVDHYPSGVYDDVGIYDCLYWLHTHSADGVIHVESPVKATYTLGQFFDIWRQPLSANQVGPAHGHVVIFENGKKFVGNPRAVPLLAQAVIQIDVGSPVVAFHPLKFKVSGGCGEGTTSCKPTKG